MASISVCRSVLLAAALLAAPLVHAEQATVFRGPVVASIDEAPADIAAATLATVALLRGLPDAGLPPEVAFKPGVAGKLRDPDTRFEGFDLTDIHLTYVGPSRSGQPGRHLVGSLVFTDEAGRQAEQAYAIDYTFRREGILVHEAVSDRQPPPRPRAVMYAVPASRVPANFFQTVRPFGEMLGWLADHAIDPQNMAASGPHYVFAVSLDRLGKGDRLTLDEGRPVAQTRLDIGGWQIAVRRVESLDRAVTLRTSYLPADLAWTVEDVAVLTLPGPRRAQ